MIMHRPMLNTTSTAPSCDCDLLFCDLLNRIRVACSDGKITVNRHRDLWTSYFKGWMSLFQTYCHRNSEDVRASTGLTKRSWITRGCHSPNKSDVASSRLACKIVMPDGSDESRNALKYLHTCADAMIATITIAMTPHHGIEGVGDRVILSHYGR